MSAGGTRDPAAARAERLQRNMRVLSRHMLAAPPAAPPPAVAAATEAGRAPATAARSARAAVVCWDLAHNPAGRAFVLARLLEADWDVRMIGPIWPRFGIDVWLPIRREPIAFQTFMADGLPTVWREAYRIAMAERYDLVVVSKPRLPGLLVGLAIAEQSGCPLVLDFDEDERGFAEHHVSEHPEALLREPFGETGIALTAGCWDVAGGYTVSNRNIGIDMPSRVVRHARDERTPVPDRDAARLALGIAPDDYVMAFVGTVRQHKGMAAVLDALEAIDDPRLKLLIAGVVADPVTTARMARLRGERILQHPGGSIDRLGQYLAAADVVPLIQDETSTITRSQLPAKLTDALQHGVRVVATAVPPLLEVARPGIVDIIAPDGLADWLREAMAEGTTDARREAARAYFLDEFGFGVNRVRLGGAIERATARLEHSRAAVPATLALLREATATALAAVAAAPPAEPAPGETPLEAHAGADAPASETPPAPLAAPAKVGGGTGRFDVAFFWKQNDSDIYGRRSDMLAKAFAAHPDVGTVIHFDHPLSRKVLAGRAAEADRASAHALVFQNTVARVLGLADRPGFLRRTRIEATGAEPQTIGGVALPSIGGDAAFVRAAMESAGLDPATTVAWICPIVRGIEDVLDAVPFRAVVADLIDDQREWATSPERRDGLTSAYASVLARAGLVFTNCEENRARFGDLAGDIVVVPNGAETAPPEAEPPAWLLDLPQPRIGYVGNLANRIDWDLLIALATMHPDWSFPVIGDHGRTGLPEAALAVPNLTFPGVVPYETARAAMRTFDAAIVPHTIDAMTEVMNPLKVYNYLAAGLPVVGTAAARVPDAGHLVTIADDAAGFSAALTRLLAGREAGAAHDTAAFSWSARLDAIMARLRPLTG